MGDLMPGIPSIPGNETTWAAAVDQFETLKKGDKPISLTNWDDTDTVPAVAAGSALEIAGATYRFPSESAISDESGLASGVVYVVVKTNDPDANSATAYFTNTAPEWRDDLNGWYDTTGAYRYTGHLMDWDGVTAYTKKRVYHIDGNNNLIAEVDGSITAGDIYGENGVFNGVLLSLKNAENFDFNINNGESKVLPVGYHYISTWYCGTQGSHELSAVDFEINISGTWYEFWKADNVSEGKAGILPVFSNGGNIRAVNNSGTNLSLSWLIVVE